MLFVKIEPHFNNCTKREMFLTRLLSKKNWSNNFVVNKSFSWKAYHKVLIFISEAFPFEDQKFREKQVVLTVRVKVFLIEIQSNLYSEYCWKFKLNCHFLTTFQVSQCTVQKSWPVFFYRKLKLLQTSLSILFLVSNNCTLPDYITNC